MSSFKEIVTKAVVGKGKKSFTNEYLLKPDNTPFTILGCWIINHTFNGEKVGDSIKVSGSFDTNIWYSTEDNTKTDVAKQTINYEETIPITKSEDYDGQDEVIIRIIKQPTCIKAEIVDNQIKYIVEKTIATEIVGDTKIRLGIDSTEDNESSLDDEINNEIKEDFLK